MPDNQIIPPRSGGEAPRTLVVRWKMRHNDIMPRACSRPLTIARLLPIALGVAMTPGQQPSAPPTEPAHRPMIGQFLDPDGEPIAGAEVTVAWNPAGHAELGAAGLNTGRTSARGYFAIRAPVATALAIWAIGPPDDQGRSRCSKPIESTVGAQRLELRAADTLIKAVPITVGGLQPWRDLGPFKLRVHPCLFVNLTNELPIDDEDRATLPLLPFSGSRAEVVDRNGQTLSLTNVTNRSQRLAAGHWAEKAIRVAPPQTLRLLARDPAGEPVAQVAIHQRIGKLDNYGREGLATGPRGRWRLLGKTDDQGRLEAVVPLARDPHAEDNRPDFVLRASKAGYADSHSGHDDVWFVDGKKLDADASIEQLELVMAPEQPLAGNLSLPGDQLPSRLRVTWTSKIAEDNGWTHLDRSGIIAVEADGNFALPGLPLDAYGITLHSTNVRQAKQQGGSWLPMVLLQSHERPEPDWDPAPGGLHVIEITARHADGTPCQGSRVIASMGHNKLLDFNEPPLTFALDISGRGRVLMPAGDWLILIAMESGYAYARAFEEERPVPVDLELQPFDELHGTVVDEQQQPVPDANINVFQTRSRWAGARLAT